MLWRQSWPQIVISRRLVAVAICPICLSMPSKHVHCKTWTSLPDIEESAGPTPEPHHYQDYDHLLSSDLVNRSDLRCIINHGLIVDEWLKILIIDVDQHDVGWTVEKWVDAGHGATDPLLLFLVINNWRGLRLLLASHSDTGNENAAGNMLLGEWFIIVSIKLWKNNIEYELLKRHSSFGAGYTSSNNQNTCDHNIINFHIINSSLVACHCFSDIFSVMNIVILFTGHCIVDILSTSVWTDVNYSQKCEMFWRGNTCYERILSMVRLSEIILLVWYHAGITRQTFDFDSLCLQRYIHVHISSYIFIFITCCLQTHFYQ